MQEIEFETERPASINDGVEEKGKRKLKTRTRVRVRQKFEKKGSIATRRRQYLE